VLWQVEGTEGKAVRITLSNLLLVIPVIVLTIIATRNVPGLMEIAFLQHLPISNAARYAITTIARYVLVALGIVIACRLLGLRWTSVQWLVAALGVGLGFRAAGDFC
jgi:potassium efflux system protein